MGMHPSEVLWQKLVKTRKKLFPENKVKKARTDECWIYEAYALLKLAKYDEAKTQVHIGLEGLRNRKGRSKSIRQNVREYGLVNIIINLSIYLLSQNQEDERGPRKVTYQEL